MQTVLVLDLSRFLEIFQYNRGESFWKQMLLLNFVKVIFQKKKIK